MTPLLMGAFALGMLGAVLPWLACRARAVRAWRSGRRSLGTARTSVDGLADGVPVTLRGRLAAAEPVLDLEDGRPVLSSTYVLRAGRHRFGRALCRTAPRIRLELGGATVWLCGAIALRAGVRERWPAGRIAHLHDPNDAEQAMLGTRGVFRSVATGDCAIVRGVLYRSRVEAQGASPYRSEAAEWSLEPEVAGGSLEMVSARTPRVAGPGWGAAAAAALALVAVGALPASSTVVAHSQPVPNATSARHAAPRVFRRVYEGRVTNLTPVEDGLCFLQSERPVCWRDGVLAALDADRATRYATLAASGDGQTVCALTRPDGPEHSPRLGCWDLRDRTSRVYQAEWSSVGLVVGDAAICVQEECGGPRCWSRDPRAASDETRQTWPGRVVPPSRPTCVERTPQSMVTGSAHWCGLDELDRVLCWGSDEVGQRGDGSARRPAAEPSAVDLSAVELAATESTTCARAQAGTVSCWGASSYGALGNGTASTPPSCSHVGCQETNTDPPSTIPVPVSGVSDALRLAAGAGRFCVLGASGALRCWGRLVDERSGGSCRFGIDRYGPSEDCSAVYRDHAVVIRESPGADDLRMGAGTACVHHRGRGWTCWTARLDAPIPAFGLSDLGDLDACGQLRIEAARAWQGLAVDLDSSEPDDFARAVIETTDWPAVPVLERTRGRDDQDLRPIYRAAVERTRWAAWHCGGLLDAATP